VILAPALAALAARGLDRGFRPYEKTLLALAWAMPLLARTVMGWTGFPLAVAVLVVLLVVAARPAFSAQPLSGSAAPYPA
jgi:hypothetical protein